MTNFATNSCDLVLYDEAELCPHQHSHVIEFFNFSLSSALHFSLDWMIFSSRIIQKSFISDIFEPLYFKNCPHKQMTTNLHV